MTATIDDVQQLLKAGRTSRVEWFNEPVSVNILAETLVAFANGQGGTVLFGITGNPASIAGVRNVSQVMDWVSQAALTIDPHLIIPMPQVLRVNSKPLIVLEIPNGLPHIYALEGRFLRRDAATNVPIPARDVRRLMVERGEMSFESEPVPGAESSDLDWDKVKTYVASLPAFGGNSAEQVLLQRGCLVKMGSDLRPTHAGILLFGKNPQQFVRGAEVTAARFGGEGMGDTFIRQDITGTLPDQIRRAEVFLRDHLHKDVQIGQTMARTEQYEYPLEAARELLVNAVAHRDYQIRGDGIRLFTFSNRMEISSPGSLPGPMTLHNLKEERFSRNPAIVQVLSDMGFIERLGYGVDRVIDLMRKHGLREPDFSEWSGGFRVVLHNQNDKEAENAVVAITAYNGVEVNPRQQMAITHLKNPKHNGRITNSDLQALCPDVHPETIRRDLADLVSKNILQKMGQKRGSYYVLSKN